MQETPERTGERAFLEIVSLVSGEKKSIQHSIVNATVSRSTWASVSTGSVYAIVKQNEPPRTWYSRSEASLASIASSRAFSASSTRSWRVLTWLSRPLTLALAPARSPYVVVRSLRTLVEYVPGCHWERKILKTPWWLGSSCSLLCWNTCCFSSMSPRILSVMSSQMSSTTKVEDMVVKLTLLGRAPSKIPAAVDSLAATEYWVTSSARFPLVGHVGQRMGLLHL